METFSALLAFVQGVHRSPVKSPRKGQWRGDFMFSLICAWMNSWVNNREVGDATRHTLLGMQVITMLGLKLIHGCKKSLLVLFANALMLPF